MNQVELADAILARVESAQIAALDGDVSTTPAGAYAVLYSDAPRLRPASHAADFRRQSTTWRWVCTGRDPAECRWVTGQVLDRMTGWSPEPGNRSTGRFVPVPDGAPILPDKSVPGDIRFSQTLLFRLSSTRS